MDYSYYKNILNKGVMLIVHYTEKEENIIKFSPIASGQWLSCISSSKRYHSDEIYNICTKQIFNFDNKNIKTIEYLYYSQDNSIDDLLAKNIDLKKDINHFTESKTIVKNYRRDYETEILRTYIDFRKNSDADYDLYVLRFYPKIYPKNSKKIIKLLKKDLAEKFFLSSYNETENVQNINNLSNIEGFKILGILEKNTNVTDPVFLNALKAKWYELIKIEKEIVLHNLKVLDVKSLNYKEQEEKELLEEIKELTDKLNEIDITVLNNFQTPKEVISYWPSLLQPEPYYVYKGEI